MAFLIVERKTGSPQSHELREGATSVGRSVKNDIQIDDDFSVSRHHSVFLREGEACTVRDAGSRHGTLVNGKPVVGVVGIRLGDRITLGDTVIRLVADPDDEPTAIPPPVAPSVDLELAAGRSMVVPVSEIVGSREPAPRTIEAPRFAGAQTPHSRAFAILTQTAENLVGEQSLEQVLDVIMDMVDRAASPDRGALLLLEGDPPRPVTRAVRGLAVDGEGLPVSRTIADAVLRDQQAVIAANAMLDPRFAAAESIMTSRVRSAMGVPLWNNRDVIGLIYVDQVSEDAAGYSRDDLEVLTLLANMAAIKIENVRLFERDRQMREMERELAAAARIQQRLLPASAPPVPGYVAAGRNEPCLAVGGDYFDLQLRDEGELGLAVGDVSGKGLGAALLMAGVQAAFRAHHAAGADPAELGERLNRVVLDNSGDAQFLTFFCGELNAASGRLRWINAGHNPPFLIRRDGPVEKLFSGALVLGILPDIAYEIHESQLAAGDLLALYSDGITEARGPGDEEFGEERLVDLLRSLRGTPVDTILENVLAAVEDFSRGEPRHDDMTLVLLRRE